MSDETSSLIRNANGSQNEYVRGPPESGIEGESGDPPPKSHLVFVSLLRLA